MPKPTLEWTCAAIGGLLAAATLAVIAFQIPGSDGRAAPNIEAKAAGIAQSASGHLVRIEVSNTGKRTAAGVEIEGRLEEGGRTVETSRMTFDYVLRGSTTRGGLWFTRDPAGYALTIRAIGYREP